MDDFFKKPDIEEEDKQTGKKLSRSARQLLEEERIRGAKFLRDCFDDEEEDEDADSDAADDELDEDEDYDEFSGDITPTLDLHLADYPVLSAEEEREQLLLLSSSDAKAAKRAFDTLVLSNSRMVISVVRRFVGIGSCDFADLYQGGVIGLMKALRNFDTSKNVRLMTYARDWILQYASRTVASYSTIHLPDSKLPLMRMIRSVRQKYMSEHHTEPSIRIIAEELDMQPQEIASVLRAAENLVASIDTPAGEEDIDFLDTYNADPDGAVTGPTESEVISKMAKEELRRRMPEVMRTILGKKHENELTVLILRNGFEGHEPCTLEEIGRRMGISRERVRQLENQGKRRLRNDARFRQLMIYLEDED